LIDDLYMQMSGLRMGWCYKKTEVEVKFFCWKLSCILTGSY